MYTYAFNKLDFYTNLTVNYFYYRFWFIKMYTKRRETRREKNVLMMRKNTTKSINLNLRFKHKARRKDICVIMYMCVCIYIYIYRERERERRRELTISSSLAWFHKNLEFLSH